MIYQVNMMSGQKIPLATKEELLALVEAANKGARLVITKYGVVNPASIDSIVRNKSAMEEVAEQMKYVSSREEAESRALGAPDFADLAEKTKMLS